jgi:hypothetical protein
MATREGAFKGGRGLWRIENPFSDLPLTLQGKAHDFVLFDGFEGGIPRSAYNEIREAPPLHFSGAFEQRVNVCGQTRFEPGCDGDFLVHTTTVRQIAVSVKFVDNPDV